jgi:hypothetical protein
MTKTVPIIYNGGSYGTYLEWCLTSLCSSQPIIDPFTGTGSSHKFQGNFVSCTQDWQQYLSTGAPHQLVRSHPKIYKTESISKNLNEILNSVDNIIYLYPDKDSVLLTVNNYFTKIWDDWWSHQFFTEIDVSKIYSNWEVADIPIGEIPTWIRREFLSFYLMPAWYDQVEWYHLDSWNHPRSHNILVKDLLYDFESVIDQLQQTLNFCFVRPVSDLLPYHKKNLQLQKFKNQDKLCKNIVDSVVNNFEFDWSDQLVPLASESWIQWQLRNLGYEIQCHGLDTFPTNSVHLQKLIYPV